MRKLRFHSRIITVTCSWFFILLVASIALCATPSSGTLTDSNTVTYTAGPFLIPNPNGLVDGVPTCDSVHPCDDFSLTVNVSSAAASAKLIKVKVKWPTVAAQFDAYVINGAGKIVGYAAASSTNVDPDLILLPALNGVYTVRVVPFNPAGQSVTATIALVNKTPASPAPTGQPPRFQNYPSSSGKGTSAGEPSVGVDWKPNVASLKHDKVNTGGVSFFTSGIQELRAGFDDCSSPAASIWEDVTSPFVQQFVLSDPIGFVDHTTGRIFQLDLIGGQGNSFAAFSDDDGQTWTPMQGGGAPAGPDHETLGGGPFAAPLTRDPAGALYPNAIYYCSQDIVGNAQCSRSDDGGLTFGPGVPIFQDPTLCLGGIHGHVKVAPDGTVYVPNATCGVNDASAGFAVSTDNGLTWATRTVPGSSVAGALDPSIGIGQNNLGRPAGSASNTIYFGWINGDGHPNVAVSRNRGITWTNIYDAGAPFGIQSSVFPVVTAGDDNRAAFGFLGTPAGGDYQDIQFPGIWHFYIATTYDGGNTWFTTDATAEDPVQIGPICTSGLFCSDGDRNLLDFNDLSLDSQGRILAAYADGCVAPGCNASSPSSASRSAKASIIRQSGGRRLFAAFDPVEPQAPGAPKLNSATRLANGVLVQWSEPDDGGSDITRYAVYRGTTSGSETFLANTSNAEASEFLDTTANASTSYYYQVSAVNASGSSNTCGEIKASGSVVTPPAVDSCTGNNVVVDPEGDAVNPAASGSLSGNMDQADIVSTSFSLSADKQNLVTTLKLKNLTLSPINGTTYTSYFVAWTSSNGKTYAAEVDIDPATTSTNWGEFDPSTNQLTTFNASTSTVVQGPNGSISVTVPLAGVGNPVIPIGDPSATAAVTHPYAVVISGEGVLGAGLIFTQPDDRAPDSGYGQRWAVCSANATRLSISAPAGANPGTAFNIQVAAQNDSGAIATSYAGTIHFTSTDAIALLPPNYTFTSADGGVHAFTVTLKTAGVRSITATDTAASTITGSASVTVGSTPPTETCLNTATQVLTDPSGDQGAANPSQVDVRSVSIGEDYRYSGLERLVFKLKVSDLNTIPASYIWRVRFNVGATTYYVAMTSDTNSVVSYEYGTQSGNTVTTVGAVEAASFTTDGTITITLAQSKVGAQAGAALTSVNGLTQQNVGNALFAGADSTSSGNYTVRQKSASCTPGSLPAPTIVATYIKGGMDFSPSFTVKAPYIGQDVEPSLRADKFGNTYVAGIRGVPGGTDLWYFDLRPTIPGPSGTPIANPNYDPFLRNPAYRGQPDSITGSQDASVGADGGGDIDIAVGFDPAAQESTTPPSLAYSSLVLANISTQRSTDRGKTFLKNPAGNATGGIPADDRQWLEFFGKDQVYLFYRTLEPAVTQVQRSIDGGLTYGPAHTAGLIGQAGGIDIDQNDGTVYIAGSNGVVAVGIPPAPGLEPLTYTVYPVAGTGKAHIFFTIKVASDGTAYACYSDGKDVLIQYTKNKGQTWSPAIRVSDGAETKTAVFPWMETGTVPGTIGVVWYGTDGNSPANDSDRWNVYYALGTQVTSSNPTFRQAVASDHMHHAANISESGLVLTGPAPNRNLADYFQVAFDPYGGATIAYTDDHNDFSGQVYVTHQISGPGVAGNNLPPVLEGSALPPPAPFSTDGSQVVDFARDIRYGGNVEAGGLIVLPTDDPIDVLSIRYAMESNGSVLAATMKLSDLTTIPPSSGWRINFAVNAPDSRMSPTGLFSFGLSDQADQFFLRASTDASGVQTFVYGTAVRNFDASLAYTDRGNADFGAFDSVNKTVTLKVSLSKLNAILSAAGHPQIGRSSILTGLRGQAFTNIQGNNVKLDSTRGGTQLALNRPPVAANDSFSTNEDVALNIAAPGVLSNDTDPDGDSLQVILVSNVAHGTLTLNSNGSFAYKPAANYNGADSFSYKANDGLADSNIAVVSLTINAVNDPPIAANDQYTATYNTQLSVAAPGVLANDSDIDSPSITAVKISNPAHGSVVLNANGSFTYTPVTNYSGPDSFTYKAKDSGNVQSNLATVSINVTAPPAAGKASGSGEVAVSNPAGIANFGFNVQRSTAGGPISGQLQYQNQARSLDVRSSTITTFTISGTTATISGNCTKNGVACTFTATVQDVGEPGKNKDQFTIAVSGEPVEGGTITKGNVQVH